LHDADVKRAAYDQVADRAMELSQNLPLIGDAATGGILAAKAITDSRLDAKAEPSEQRQAEITAAATVSSGTYRELRSSRVQDAHHIIQDKAAEDLPGYNRNDAPAAKLAGPSTTKGTPHYNATQVQRQAGGGTYAAERRIGYKALRRGGYTPSEARSLIEEADEYFKSLGVTPSTATRIPGNRTRLSK
jgi:hypothetical protein